MSDLPPLRDVIRRHGLTARKGLGQHFLLDLNLTSRIAGSAGDITLGTTIEVGPGPGGLTRALLDKGARVFAIEKDSRCLNALSELRNTFAGQLDILEANALDMDLTVLGEWPRRIVSNLPYNIGTALLVKWLEQPIAFTSITVMLQKEVAARLTARPGSKAYGRLSILAGWQWSVTRVFDISPAAFTPPPTVDSTLLHIVPLAQPVAKADGDTLARVTAAAFGQRRKMLRSSLKVFGDTQALCAAAGLEPTLRAERVSIAGFCALARAIAASGNSQ